MPGGTVAATDNDRLETPLARVGVESTAVTPVGRPDTASVMFALNPTAGVTVMVLRPLAPGWAATVDGLRVMATSVNSTSSNWVWRILPSAWAVMTTFDVEAAKPAGLLSDNVVIPVDGLGEKLEFTPTGRPATRYVTDEGVADGNAGVITRLVLPPTANAARVGLTTTVKSVAATPGTVVAAPGAPATGAIVVLARERTRPVVVGPLATVVDEAPDGDPTTVVGNPGATSPLTGGSVSPGAAVSEVLGV